MEKAFVFATAAIFLLSEPFVWSSVQAKEAWTARPRGNPPSVAIRKTATDGRTVFDGGCNKLLGPGVTGTFSGYRGDALEKVDDRSEPVTFEIAGKNGTEKFSGGLHYLDGEAAWGITGLLPPPFVAAFNRGETLTIRNARGVAVFSFDLQGSSKAAKTMQHVCGFVASSSASAPRRWHAMSTTAISITGDIRVSENAIRFENGAVLQLAATDRPSVFRVETPVNPVLKNGNVLCGRQPQTFVAFGRDDNAPSLDRSSTLYLKIYNGRDAPPASDSVGMNHKGADFCALYNYTR